MDDNEHDFLKMLSLDIKQIKDAIIKFEEDFTRYILYEEEKHKGEDK